MHSPTTTLLSSARSLLRSLLRSLVSSARTRLIAARVARRESSCTPATALARPRPNSTPCRPLLATVAISAGTARHRACRCTMLSGIKNLWKEHIRETAWSWLTLASSTTLPCAESAHEQRCPGHKKHFVSVSQLKNAPREGRGQSQEGGKAKRENGREPQERGKGLERIVGREPQERGNKALREEGRQLQERGTASREERGKLQESKAPREEGRELQERGNPRVTCHCPGTWRTFCTADVTDNVSGAGL